MTGSGVIHGVPLIESCLQVTYSVAWSVSNALCGAMDCVASRATTNTRFLLRQNNPTGKSPKVCPAPRAKIFRLTRRANHRFKSARLTQERGGARSSGTLRWDAVDVMRAQDERADGVRRSRVVLTPRRWCQACGAIRK